MIRPFIVIIGLSLAAGCSKDAPTEAPAAEPAKEKAQAAPVKEKTEAQPGSDHGDETALGTVSVAGFDFEVAALGALEAGSDAAVAAKVVKTPDGRDWKTANVYMWVEDANGKKLSAPEKGKEENGRLHAHASIPASTTEAPAKVVVRVRDGDTDERGVIALEGAAGAKPADPKGHTHAKTPHDGVVSKLRAVEGGADAGWLELKLHDDEGDLELWLTTDEAGKAPFDIAPGSAISVTFVDHGNRKVSLAPRNTEKNEDEDGQPNMRDGKTAYFIFPGETGADASWLKGKAFQSVVFVDVDADGRKLRSEEFVLKPHTHHDGAGH